MSNTPRALSRLLDEHNILRTGWRNKFHLSAEPFDGLSEIGSVGPLTIVRVNADGSKWPWTPTEDDMFASDWITYAAGEAFNGGPPDSDGDSFAWALSEIQCGRDVIIGDGPLRLTGGETHGGPCIDIVLPDGSRRLWRPQHQDLWGVYSPAVPRV
jgi:hypothetical protein